MRLRRIALALLAVIIIAGLTIVIARRTHAPTTSKLTESAPSTQTNDIVEQPDDMQLPNINTDQFKLVGATVNCSTSTTDSQTVRSCSGSIRIIPVKDPDRDVTLYKINEQTTLLHNGQPEDINQLQQLAQNQTVISLKSQPQDEYTIAQISY